MRRFDIFALCTIVAACSASEEVRLPELRDGSVRVQSRDLNGLAVSTMHPIQLGQNELAVSFPASAGAELLDVSALMPAHGHGSKPPTVERAVGGYRVSHLVLYMSGRWELRLRFRLDGREDEALLAVDVP